MTISTNMAPKPKYPKYLSTDIENQFIVTHHIEIHISIPKNNQAPKIVKFRIESALCNITQLQRTV